MPRLVCEARRGPCGPATRYEGLCELIPFPGKAKREPLGPFTAKSETDDALLDTFVFPFSSRPQLDVSSSSRTDCGRLLFSRRFNVHWVVRFTCASGPTAPSDCKK
jgi:hypothetical protein